MIGAGLPTLGCRRRTTTSSYDQGQETLVAWVLTNGNGSIGMLHTVPDLRGRGLARALVQRLLPLWLKRGFGGCPPFCYIVPTNDASVKLFKGLGFEKRADMEWIGLGFAPNSLERPG